VQGVFKSAWLQLILIINHHHGGLVVVVVLELGHEKGPVGSEMLHFSIAREVFLQPERRVHRFIRCKALLYS